MVGRGGLVAVGRSASVAVGASPALGVEDVRAEEAGVSDSAVARSESGMSVGSAVARAGRSVGSSEPPQASISNGRSSARAMTPRKRRGVLISIRSPCLLGRSVTARRVRILSRALLMGFTRTKLGLTSVLAAGRRFPLDARQEGFHILYPRFRGAPFWFFSRPPARRPSVD